MKIAKRCLLGALAGVCLSGAPTSVSAQESTTYVPDDEIKQNEAEAASGEGRLDGTFGLSASVALASNQNVVGQPEGLSALIGLGIVGGLDYLKGDYEMRNTLTINEAFSRTPALEEFVKTNDVAELENLHNYFFNKWFGVFGRLNVTANVFQTNAFYAQEQDFVVIDENDEVVEELVNGSNRVKLNDPIFPLTLNQSLGAFVEPIKSVPVSLSVRAGLGGRETIVDGGGGNESRAFIVDDLDGTDTIEVRQLTNVYQGGGEVFLALHGATKDKRVSYRAGASLLYPLLNNDDQNRSATELTRIAADAQLIFGVYEWLNVVYSFRAVRDPLLIEGVQLQNNLNLTFQYTFVERSTAKPTDPSEIEKAKKRAAQAEERAAQAEERAAEMEARLKAMEEASDAEEEVEETTPEQPEQPEQPDTPPSPAPEGAGADTP